MFKALQTSLFPFFSFLLAVILLVILLSNVSVVVVR